MIVSEADYEETAPSPDGFFAQTDDASCSVKVAIRVRPFIGKELREGSQRRSVECSDPLNLQIGSRGFVFDRVFDDATRQEEVFDVCARNLILGCFKGFNATILAYGQTGSGKTHSMGTGSTVGLSAEQVGIVPRVFDFIFEELDKRRANSEGSEFSVKLQFMELYGDELHDLLDIGPVDKITGTSTKQIQIREEKNGSISVQGLKAEIVTTKAECLTHLNRGISKRVTAATLMNEASSRSHAILTLTIDQKIVQSFGDDQNQQEAEQNISAKFHFVDLAGSERIKKTGATGKTMQEGISINKGLLILGNVIACLTDEKRKNFIPYRDSKLTRILQDSLGGNSRTTFIACVSPAETNYEETLSTIQYASRARNIKNKPVVNRDANSMLIESLRTQIVGLQTEVGEYKKLLVANNIPLPTNLSQRVEESKQQLATQIQRNRSTSFAGALPVQASSPSIEPQSGATSQEMRQLKLALARKEKEVKDLREELSALKENRQANSDTYADVEKERDELVLKNEQLTELLTKNGVQAPPPTSQEKVSIGGKRSQTLIEEYKTKLAKVQAESDKRAAEVLAKSKKIAELQTQMKRDEMILKKAVEEAGALKRSVKKQGSENPSASRQLKLEKGAPQLIPQIDVPDAEQIKNQFMDQLTSKLENFFIVDDSVDHSASAANNTTLDTTGFSEVGDPDHHVEKTLQETSRATSLEEKEKLIGAVKQNVDQIKSDLGELLKNTWAQRIQEIQVQMSKIEQEKGKNLASATMDKTKTQQIEKEYQKKMEELKVQLLAQQTDKKKKEDSLAKTMTQQEVRIKAMEQEIAKMKKERDELLQAKKYGDERFSKFKSTAVKDLNTAKKAVQDKDKAVSKLKQDLKKTDQLVSQKISELKGLQKKIREEKERQKKEEERENQSQGIDVDAIKDWITQSTEQLLKQQELAEYLKKQVAMQDEVEEDMLREGDRLTELSVQKERCEMELQMLQETESDEVRQLELEEELEEINIEYTSITQTLDVLEEHYDHLQGKINQLSVEVKAFDFDSVKPPMFKGLNSVEMARATLRTFFMVLLDLNVYKRDLENKCIEQDEKVLDLESRIAVLSEQSGLSQADQQIAMRKQAAMRQLVGQLGDETEFLDQRAAADLELNAAEQRQLTKMSLSKIVSNLRSKLKQEEQRVQNVTNKLEQVLKEKEAFKLKYTQLQKEVKMSGGLDRMNSSFLATTAAPARPSKPSGGSQSAVKSKIDTGRDSAPEPFIGYATATAVQKRTAVKANDSDLQRERLSFKQRRDLQKEKGSAEKPSPATRRAAVVSQPKSQQQQQPQAKTSPQPSSLKERRASRTGRSQEAGSSDFDKLSSKVMELEQALGSRKGGAAGLNTADGDFSDDGLSPYVAPAASQPETVPEEVEESSGDELLVMETDEVLVNMTKGVSTSAINTSLFDQMQTNDFTWALEQVIKQLQLEDGQKVVDIDSIDDRLFILLDSMKMVEISLASKEILKETNLAELDGAQEFLEGQRAHTFAMFKELNVIGLSTDDNVLLFDYEDELMFIKTLPAKNVTFMCFIDQYLVIAAEADDASESELLCFQFDGDEPEGRLSIKQFMGQRLLVRQGDQCIFFATGSQIGRIQVPEMELIFQEDAGHEVLDFVPSNTCIFTTGKDSSLRLFDADQGMMLIEPMEEMEVDSLAIQGFHLVARCGGGQAMIVFKYTDGMEELEEQDFIECEEDFGGVPANDSLGHGRKFLMKGGLEATLNGTDYRLILIVVQNIGSLTIKMLKNRSYTD